MSRTFARALAAGLFAAAVLTSFPTHAASIRMSAGNNSAFDCVDDFRSQIKNGNVVDRWSCNAQSNQDWTFVNGNIQLDSSTNKCIMVSDSSNGSTVQLSSCDQSADQLWTVSPRGEIMNQASGYCLDASVGHNSQLRVYRCNGSASQQWFIR
jgi:hypothetical protein